MWLAEANVLGFVFIQQLGRQSSHKRTLVIWLEEAHWQSLIGSNLKPLIVALKVQRVKFGHNFFFFFFGKSSKIAYKYINKSLETHYNDCVLVFLPIEQFFYLNRRI